MKMVVCAVVGFLKKEDGVTAVECALMLALVLVICVVAINQVSPTGTVGEPVIVQTVDSGR